MITINGKNINGYNDYSKLNGQDLIAFMKTQSNEDIQSFKAFAQTPKVTKYDDGTEVERAPSFFELRNWVLEKYAPGITAPQSKKAVGKKLIDEIMDL